MKEHSRLLVRSDEWDQKGRNDSFLLTGDDLEAAEAWLVRANRAAQEDKKPEPTPLQGEYIAASRLVENRRQRRRVIATSIALGTISIFAILSLGLFFQSEGRRETSEQRGTAVAKALNVAEDNLHQAWTSQALFLADLAEQQAEPGNARKAVLIALEGLEHYADGVYNPENHQALVDSLALPGVERFALHHEGWVRGAQWNHDETRLLTWSADGTARIWDATTGEELAVLRHEPSEYGVWRAVWNANETQVLTWSADGTARVWDTATGAELLTLQHEESVRVAAWNQDQSLILTLNDSDGICLETCQREVTIWDAVSGELLFTLPHETHVYGTVWNHDGTQILTWENNGTAHIWDSSSGEELFALHQEEGDGPVREAAWSPDETCLLTLAWDSGAVRLWDATSGDLQRTIAPADDSAMGVMWNTNGTRLLTWGKAVQIWDPTAGEELLSIHPESMVNGVAWNADETRLLTWEFNASVQVWDMNNGDELLTVHNTNDGVVGGLNAQWNHDETRLLTVSYENPARVWDTATGEVLLTLSHDDTVNGASWNHDETLLLSWSEDGTAHVWDIASAIPLTLQAGESINKVIWNQDGTTVLAWPFYSGPARIWDASTGAVRLAVGEAGGVDGAAWNNDETRLLIWSIDNSAQVWDVEQEETVLTLQHESFVVGAAWNRDETRLLTWSADGTARIWDASSGKELLVLTQPATTGLAGIMGAMWDADQSRLVTWSYMDDSCTENCPYEAIVWDVSTGEILSFLNIYPQTFIAVGDAVGFPDRPLNPDGIRLLTWNNSDVGCVDYCQFNVTIWDVDSGEMITLFHEDIVENAAWNHDGSRVLTWSWDGTARVWDAESGVELLKLVHDNSVVGAMWNHNESRLLTWSRDDTARVWDTESGEELLTLRHGSDLFSTTLIGASWNQDETYLLTWSNDRTARVWDAATGQELFSLPHSSMVLGAAWNPDETRILTWSDNGIVSIWPVAIDQLITQAQNLNLRPLTDQERAKFFLPSSMPILNQ